MQCVRWFATSRRSVPYIAKGNWRLPDPGTAGEAINKPETPPAVNSEEWGSIVEGAGTNVPKGWRHLGQLPQWKRQMFALKEKFPEGWNPMRKLNREEMTRLRDMKAAQPQISNNVLGDIFKISPEAVRRIVKSRWRPSQNEEQKISSRWTRRGVRLGSPVAKRNLTKKSPRKRLRDPGQDVF